MFSFYFCLGLEEEKINGWKRNSMNPQINRAWMELTKESPKQGCWLSCEGEDIISLEEVNSNIWLLKL